MTPEEHLQEALTALGYGNDPKTEQTAERLAAFLREQVAGDVPELSTFAVDRPSLVRLDDIPFHALCAHHLLPFFGTASITYFPKKRVGGFSGIARRLQHHCMGPQLQERIASRLAADLYETLDARAVRVRLTARQMCMEMRGARVPSTITVIREEGDVPLLGVPS